MLYVTRWGDKAGQLNFFMNNLRGYTQSRGRKKRFFKNFSRKDDLLQWRKNLHTYCTTPCLHFQIFWCKNNNCENRYSQSPGAPTKKHVLW